MATKPNIWMPLYVADWNEKTRHLTCEQDGAYGRLIRSYWTNGAPSDNDDDLARIVGMSLRNWRTVRPILAKFFIIRDGRWFHDRVETELSRARAIVEKRRSAGMLGGRPKKANAFTDEKQKVMLTKTPARVIVSLTDSSVVAGPSEEPYPGKKDSDSQEEALGEGVVRFPGRPA